MLLLDIRYLIQLFASDMLHVCILHLPYLCSYCLRNPNSYVWLLLLAYKHQSSIGDSSMHILRLLLERYNNLQLATLNMALTLHGTPLQDLLSSGRLRQSREKDILTYHNFNLCWLSVSNYFSHIMSF